MSFYIILFGWVIASSVCASFCKDKYLGLVFQFITFLVLFLPAAFRYGIGTDYPSYVNIFNNIANGGTQYKGSETGYWYLNKWVADAGGSAQVVIALVAFLTYFFMFSEVDRKKWFIYVPAFYAAVYAWTFTTLRQMLATAMCFYALCRIQKHKYVLAFIVAFLSVFFHKSMVFYIPILLFAKIFRFKKLTGVVLFFVGLAASVLLNSFIRSRLFWLIELTQYAGYIGSEWVDEPVPNTGLGRILRFASYLMIIVFFPKNKEKTPLFTLFLIYVAIDFFSQSVLIVSRIMRQLLPVFVVIPYESYKSRTSKYDLAFFVQVCCSIIQFVLLLKSNFRDSIPYATIFGGVW